MTNGQVLHYIRRIFHADSGAKETDSQLLDQFVRAHDQAAFAAIVRRHGPLVFGVCRRVLYQWQDAEDAFQAVFLVLGRKAGSIRGREQLSNWLYGVAYRTALKARSASMHRRQRESALIDDRFQSSTNDVPDPELQRVLDEEIHRLPANYRAAVIACYLDGKTYEEAARALGCPKGTVSIRLTRAREMLRTRLRRRGLGLPLAIATVAVPPALTHAAIGAGMAIANGHTAAVVSVSAAELAKGVIQAMFISKLKVVASIAAVMTTCVVGAGAAAVHVFAPAEPEVIARVYLAALPDKPKPAPAKPEDDQLPTHPITITGTATDEDGKPIKGATIYLLSLADHLGSSDGKKRPSELVGTTETDDRGEYVFRQFEFPMVRAGTEGELWGRFQLAATTPDHGFCWTNYCSIHNTPRPPVMHGEDFKFLGETLAYHFKFGSSKRLVGRLVDENEKPLAGVKLQLRSANHLFPTKKPAVNSPQSRYFQSLPWMPDSVASATTEGDGKFVFTGLPADVFFWVYMQQTDFPHIHFYAGTGEVPEPDEIERLAHYSSNKPPILTGELNLTLVRPKKITFRVVISDTGAQAADVAVSAEATRQVTIYSYSRSDKNGNADLRLSPGEFHLWLDPPKQGTDCLRTYRKITVTDAPEQSFEVRVQRGCTVVFEVIDADTGKGIPNMRFANKHDGTWRTVDESTHWGSGKPFSDADGKFRAIVNPGKGAFKVGWDRFVDLVPFPPEEWDIVPEPNDPAEIAAGIKQVELPEGKTVHVRFKLRRKAQ